MLPDFDILRTVNGGRLPSISGFDEGRLVLVLSVKFSVGYFAVLNYFRG